jgi:hypothetical protein
VNGTNGFDAGEMPRSDDPRARQKQSIFRIRHEAVEVSDRRERALAAAAEVATGEAELAQAAHHAEQQSTDPERRRRGSFPLAVFAAIVFAVLDVYPAWWAAQALNGDLRQTRIVAGLLVAGLAGFAAVVSYFQHGRQAWSYIVLHRAETYPLWRLSVRSKRLEKRAARLCDDAARARKQRLDDEAALAIVHDAQPEVLGELLDRTRMRRFRGVESAPALNGASGTPSHGSGSSSVDPA